MKVYVNKTRQVVVVLACILLTYLVGLGDAVLVALVAVAVRLVWQLRTWGAFGVALLLMLSGVFVSLTASRTCSLAWKGRMVVGKLAGSLPYLSWDGMWDEAFAQCHPGTQTEDQLRDSLKLVAQNKTDGREWDLYDTPLGQLWVTTRSKEVLPFLIWELIIQKDYESADVQIRPGDTVIDCGAHIGCFARYALSRGAGRVIAIEPMPGTIRLLEENLKGEIASGKVTVVKMGVWDKIDRLSLTEDTSNSAVSSFIMERSKQKEEVPVAPLDDIIADLALSRVDFIKMDIEGSERKALAGASRTIRRFRPRMAICSYHLSDDPTVIPLVVQGAFPGPGYRIHAKDFEIRGLAGVTPKVLFFAP